LRFEPTAPNVRLEKAMIRRIALGALILSFTGLAATSAFAQSRRPTAAETTAIRNCVVKDKDDQNKAVQECVTNLVAGPCIDKFGSTGAGDSQMADCYYIEASIWDTLLNENYKTLLGTLDAGQTEKARTMQHDWIASRDSTCNFFVDKIQGSMAVPMTAECVTEETARRALQLKIFGGL
jgi:uncharacterized protein YecT (DUF1311 family)